MMGGLLEALLMARVNQLKDKSQLFKLKCIPIDKETNKPLQLQKWMLQIYIDVAHEMNWISQSAKDVGEHLRDYRNYIHPYKELAGDGEITLGDAKMNWVIAKAIAREVLSS
jgi:hypothetical protein